MELAGIGDVLAGELHDYVLWMNASLGSRAVGEDVRDQGAAGDLHAELLRQILRHRLDADADEGAVHLAILEKLRADPLGDIHRYGKADPLIAAAGRADGGVDP